MQNTAEYYEAKALKVIAGMPDKPDNIPIVTGSLRAAQLFATLAQAAAVAEQTEQARKWEEERQSNYAEHMRAAAEMAKVLKVRMPLDPEAFAALARWRELNPEVEG